MNQQIAGRPIIMVNYDTMIEAPEKRGFSHIKEAVKLRRTIKGLAHLEDIDLRGRRGQQLVGILNHTESVLSELRGEYKDWIEQKYELSVKNKSGEIQKLGDYLAPVGPTVVEEAYQGGLATTITQEFKTYNKESREEVVKLDDPEYLRNVITAYTVEFWHSLRLSQRLEINPDIALDIARLSYHFNPTRLIQLVDKYIKHPNPDFYPEVDVNMSVIQAAVLSNPTNPEASLNRFIENVARLQAKYPDLNPSVINSAALSYPKNPDAFIDDYKAATARLQAKYPDLNPSAIERAALNYPKNPDAFIDELIRSGKVEKFNLQIRARVENGNLYIIEDIIEPQEVQLPEEIILPSQSTE